MRTPCSFPQRRTQCGLGARRTVHAEGLCYPGGVGDVEAVLIATYRQEAKY
jgi:hypothetical protein